MNTRSLPNLEWVLAQAGDRAGVFSRININYPATLQCNGSVLVEERIMDKSGVVSTLGAVIDIPFTFSPREFGIDPQTGQYNPALERRVTLRNPANNAPLGQTIGLRDAYVTLYSLCAMIRDDEVARLTAPPPAQPE